MNHITNFAESFMKLFQLGGDFTFHFSLYAGESDGNQYGTFLTRIL